MAHMFPPEPPVGGPGLAAELLLYEALRDGLDDEHFVYANLPYLERGRAAEGECDFLVLHREGGLLVIEAKGAGVHRTGTGQWERTALDGTREAMKESPFVQAQRTVKALVKKLERRMSAVLPSYEHLPLVHGHAVALPFVDRADTLPLEAEPEIVLLKGDLAHIGAWVARAFAFWRRAAPRALTPLTPPEFKTFRRAVLHPAVDLLPRLGSRLAAEERALIQLSEEQRGVLEGLLGNRRLAVEGGAGTGKTILALEAARLYAEQGGRVLLTCFNRHLRAELAASVVQPETSGAGSIEAKHFHLLCSEAFAALGQPLQPPAAREDQARFWQEEAPVVLYEALGQDLLGPWDAIVVDEAQDFAPAWWAALEEGLADTAQSRLAVFFDPGQVIFERPFAIPEGARFRLTRNFRSTRQIALTVAHLGRVDTRPHERCPEGQAPEITLYTSPARQRRDLEQLVSRLSTHEGLRPDQLTVLTPHSRPNSCLASATTLAGHRLADDPAARDGALLHTTIGAFKGLESDVIILADIDPTDPRCTRAARYVAASRARHLLYVFTNGDWLAE